MKANEVTKSGIDLIAEKIRDGRENWTEEEWRNYNEFVADAIAEEEEKVIEDMIEVDNDY